MAEQQDGRWVTLDNGVHLFIKKGQTLDDAIEKLDAAKKDRDEVYNAVNKSVEKLNKKAEETKKQSGTEKLDQHVKNVKEGKEKIEDEDYKGYSISHNFYGNGEYSVQFEGDDILFDTEEDAKAFIDRETNTNEKDDYKSLSAAEYGKKYGKNEDPEKKKYREFTTEDIDRLDEEAKDWKDQIRIANEIDAETGTNQALKHLQSYTSKPEGMEQAIKKEFEARKNREIEEVRKNATGDVKKDINKTIRDHFKGYSDEDFKNFWGDYINIDTEERKDGRTKIEVRGEFSYNEFDDLMQNGLDSYVQAIDKDAYFDQDEPGIISAYVDTKKLKNFKPNKPTKKIK